MLQARERQRPKVERRGKPVIYIRGGCLTHAGRSCFGRGLHQLRTSGDKFYLYVKGMVGGQIRERRRQMRRLNTTTISPAGRAHGAACSRGGEVREQRDRGLKGASHERDARVMRLHEPHLFSTEMLKVGKRNRRVKARTPHPLSRLRRAARHRPKGGGTLRVANKFRAVLPRASKAGLECAGV